ncbi:hypothetical protein [Acrocarpospora sp. B8E8]|uniref:hypothetical protein n=1 Tax=Acrocarpospora sp. B8E8 TaxID=3153572 RepID=UPI00325D0CFC
MSVLKYSDLIDEVEREQAAKGLEFEAKDGKVLLLRPILLLNKDELKVVRTLLKVVGDKDTDTFEQIDAMDAMLVAAADRKDAMKKSLADLPPQMKTRVFEAWMQAAKSGEASA